MCSSKSNSRTGGDRPRLSSGSADLSRWGWTPSGATDGTANDPDAIGLPDRSAKAPARTCSRAPPSADAPRAAATRPFSARVSRSVTESVPPRGGSTWASVRAMRGAPGGEDAEIDRFARSADMGSTYSSNTMRSAPLPMSSEGGCAASREGGTVSATASMRGTRAGADGLPDRSEKAPASRKRRADPAASAPPASTAPFWAGVKRSLATAGSPPSPPCIRWLPDSRTDGAPGEAADSETEGDVGVAAAATCSSNAIDKIPAPRSSTGAARRASSDGGDASSAILAGSVAASARALPDTSLTMPAATEAFSLVTLPPVAPDRAATAAFLSGAIASSTDCEPPSVMTRAPARPTASGEEGDDSSTADALAVAGSTISSNSTRTVPAARSTAAPASLGGRSSGETAAG